MRKTLFLVAWLLLRSAATEAASNDIKSGWGAWFNAGRLDTHWSLISDVQLRSSSGWDELQNLLLRPGLSYAVDDRNSLALGYAWIGTLNGPSGRRVEHRLWQQYLHTQPLLGSTLTHRVRLEQRFIESAAGADRLFSQRLRYFLRSVTPLVKPASNAGGFDCGPFLALQNEVFLNIQHADAVNDKRFDQNRAYLAVGYRMSRHWDIELGYLHQYLNGRAGDTRNHVAQLALYTRF